MMMRAISSGKEEADALVSPILGGPPARCRTDGRAYHDFAGKAILKGFGDQAIAGRYLAARVTAHEIYTASKSILRFEENLLS